MEAVDANTTTVELTSLLWQCAEVMNTDRHDDPTQQDTDTFGKAVQSMPGFSSVCHAKVTHR
jgi:hypothetical protein